jgi:hypothetical protein
MRGMEGKASAELTSDISYEIAFFLGVTALISASHVNIASARSSTADEVRLVLRIES